MTTRTSGMLALVWLLTCVGCALPPLDDAGGATVASDGAIVGGVSTSSWDSVVLVEISGWACSGVLVSPDVVLTAGHCLVGAQGDVTVSWCNSCFDPDDTWDTRQSIDWYVHPGYDPDTLAYDIGVIVLDGAAPSQPLPINRDEPQISWLGEEHPLTYVALGTTGVNADDAGVKRAVLIGVDDWDEQFLHHQDVGHTVCMGDSGGAALTDHGGDWRVAGVIAFGDNACWEHGWDFRVDAVQEWVDDATGGWEPDPGDDDDDDDEDDDSGDDDTVDDDDDGTPDDLADDDVELVGGCSCHAAGNGVALAPLLGLVLIGAVRRRTP